jgi:hypothetical protein
VDRIAQGYREIAERVEIPGSADPKADIFELVSRWLRDESKGTWLLVLDNLDDVSILSTSLEAAQISQFSGRDNQLRYSLLSYLPQSANGSILVTTRTSSVAAKIVEPQDIIMVDPMINTDAITLLKKKLDRSVDESDLEELARILEYMALAILQAAAYIRHKGARYSVQQYIEAFQRNEKRKTSLLTHEAGYLRRDADAKNSIMITWQISFDDIRDKWPASADLLSLMSYFDRQGIPKDALKVQLQEQLCNLPTQQDNDVRDDEKDKNEEIEDDSASEISGEDVFEEAVGRLKSYSFVSIGQDGRTFDMHGLVQLATRKWLEMHGEDQQWKSQFSQKLNAVFPNGDHENWGLCELLFPHAKSAERQRPMEDRSVREWAQILRKAAWYAWAKGDYREAERMCEKSVRALRKALGGEEVETSYSVGLLASVYRNQGRWTEAEKMEVQVMETRRRVLGEEHPNTLTSMASLASTYRNQGRWTEAEKMEVQVMETSRRVLGEEHPSTLTSIANLASTYRNQGRWTEAEKIDVQVIETRRRVLGEEHPSTLTSMASLATTYWNQGRWTEAEKMEVQVIETRRRVLGEEHPSTLTSMNNLAFNMKEQGKITEATKLMADCVQVRNRVLGTEHPDTLSSATALAKWQSIE